MKKELSYEKTINIVGIQTIIWNMILSIVKLVAGILSLSSSMISDAIHSASDVFTTIIVMIGARISSKKEDKDHPYGHERFESIASIFLGILLGGTAVFIGYSGIKVITEFANGTEIKTTSLAYLALISAILSIVVKGIMFIYTYKVAKRIRSSSLRADSYHHLSDSLSSFGSLLGIIGLMIGGAFTLMDPIASLIICVFILKVAFDIIKEAINQLVDKSASTEECDNLVAAVVSFEEVRSIESIKTRQFGNRIYVDLTICLDGNLSLIESNKIADSIHDYLEKNFVDVKHCQIHVNPYEELAL